MKLNIRSVVARIRSGSQAVYWQATMPRQLGTGTHWIDFIRLPSVLLDNTLFSVTDKFPWL